MPRSVLLLAAVSLSSLIPWPAALAQQGAVSVGQRVRVEWIEAARRYRAVGSVLEARSDSLALMEPAGRRMLAVSRLHRIDVSVPRSRPGGAARGAGIGALVGIAVGLATAYEGCRRPYDEFCDLGLVVIPPLGAIAGLTLGAVVGAVSPGRRWQRVR